MAKQSSRFTKNSEVTLKHLPKIMSDWLIYSALLKNCKGFRRQEQSKIGKDCQYTSKGLLGTTSWEGLVVSCMAAFGHTCDSNLVHVVCDAWFLHNSNINFAL